MSAEAIEPSRRRDFKDASPREIRAALIPEERADFDRAWQRAMASATMSFDLTEVLETLESWRRIAWMTETHGHESHRRMWRRAAALFTGEDVAANEPFSVTKGRLGY